MIKIGFVSLFSLGLMFGLSACGPDDGGHPKTHDKNLTAKAFEVRDINWTLDNHEGLKIAENKEYLYLQFDYNSTEPNMQFIIDSDNNPKTGVSIEAGADYMVENGWLFEADKSSSWGWKDLKQPIDSVVKAGDMDTVRIKKILLKNKTATINVNVEVLTKKWEPVDASPKPKNGGYPKVKFPR
jgi:hypothetical protein